MDIDEINEHIRKLKVEETSWQSVEKLAALCTVRNELNESRETTSKQDVNPVQASEYSREADPESEFVEAASAVPFSGLMQILNEHMNAIQLVYPKEYQLVMKKIRDMMR